MSAHDQIRKMLDGLMGTSRDGESEKFRVKFDDPRVCKSFLLNCCPHDILSNTRLDLGDCPHIHNPALRADYEIAAKTKDYFYDVDAMEHLFAFVAHCDRRTMVAKRKLKETQAELSEEANAKAEQINSLGEQIGTLMAKAEEIGAAGEVEKSMKMMEEVEALKRKRVQVEMELRSTIPASSYQQQKLRVCEVCGAYLGIHDNDRRLADHFGGRLHLGFIAIREKLEQLKNQTVERRILREIYREEMRLKAVIQAEEERIKCQNILNRTLIQGGNSHDQNETEKSEKDPNTDQDYYESHSSDRHKRKHRSHSRDHRKRSKHSHSRSRRSRSDSRDSHHRRHHSRSHSHSKHRHSRHSRSESGSQHKRSSSGSRERSDVNEAAQVGPKDKSE